MQVTPAAQKSEGRAASNSATLGNDQFQLATGLNRRFDDYHEHGRCSSEMAEELPPYGPDDLPEHELSPEMVEALGYPACLREEGGAF